MQMLSVILDGFCRKMHSEICIYQFMSWYLMWSLCWDPLPAWQKEELTMSTFVSSHNG